MAADSVINGGMMAVMHLSLASPEGGGRGRGEHGI